MKKTILYLLLLLFSFIEAQNKQIKETIIETQSTYFKLAPELSFLENKLKNDFFKIEDLISLSEKDKAKIFVTIEMPKFVEFKIIQEIDEKTQIMMYQPKLIFSGVLNTEVKNLDAIIYKKNISELHEFAFSKVSQYEMAKKFIDIKLEDVLENSTNKVIKSEEILETIVCQLINKIKNKP